MKKIIGFLLCLVLSVNLYAQSKDEKDVAAAVETLKKALVDANRTALENIATNELNYGHSNGLVEDKAAFVEALTSGKSDFVNINLTDQTIKIVNNVAIVRHKLSAETKNNGQAGTTNLSVLLVWQKQQGQWKLLARQAVKI